MKPGLVSGWRKGSLEKIGLLLLSAATLTFEIDLTRLFSVAQFYHFAFMIVSIALLGFGLSGTFLALFPSLKNHDTRRSLGWLALAASAAILGAYLLINNLPFDSFLIAWDRKQAAVLIIHYLALALPFFFSGLAVGILLAADPQAAGTTYAANLVGAALGGALAVAAPVFSGGEGAILIASALAGLASVLCLVDRNRPGIWRAGALAGVSALILFVTALLLGHSSTGTYPVMLELRLSPYKGLSYALQAPGAQIFSSRWNSFSRVDRIESPSIRSLPGLSYRYLGPLPKQDGLFVDGDDLNPIVLEAAGLEYASYLPSAAAFELKPAASALALEPRGGLEILAALGMGADRVTAIEPNPLIVSSAGEAYRDSRLQVVIETGRSYISSSNEAFDVILLPLTSSYHPVRSGAYSLAEDYRYTTEAFRSYLGRLNPGGIFSATRWLQTPPSECLRLFGTAAAALEELGLDPKPRLAAFRGYNTMTILASREAFSPAELSALRRFTSSRAFDLVYAPDMRPEEANRFNLLPEPIYYAAFQELLDSPLRADFYRRYPLDVRPATDNRPFFTHYYKWSQTGEIIAELGKTWQPFGGAGYFVILAVLALAGFSALMIILLPVVIGRLKKERGAASRPVRGFGSILAYFGLIGFGFMLVEMPLIQRFILYIGQPTYSMATVLCSLLLFSGVGSLFSSRLPLKTSLAALAMGLILLERLLPAVFERTLGTPLPVRLLATFGLLAPLGLLMGIPFAGGIRWMQRSWGESGAVAWAWAANGAASVVASVLSALLAISLGFQFVFLSGALCYVGAWVVSLAPPPLSPSR